MRTTKSYILRLFVDSDEPDSLRGTLRPVLAGEEYTFPDENTLTSLLHRICRQCADQPLQDSEQTDFFGEWFLEPFGADDEVSGTTPSTRCTPSSPQEGASPPHSRGRDRGERRDESR